MIQLYPLSLLTLALSSLLSFLEVFKAELSFLLRLKMLIRRNAKLKNAILISSIAIASLMLLFPLYPGPVILGDLLPSTAIFHFAITLRKMSEADDVEIIFTDDLLSSKVFRRAVAYGICFFLHFLFPSFIIL